MSADGNQSVAEQITHDVSELLRSLEVARAERDVWYARAVRAENGLRRIANLDVDGASALERAKKQLAHSLWVCSCLLAQKARYKAHVEKLLRDLRKAKSREARPRGSEQPYAVLEQKLRAEQVALSIARSSAQNWRERFEAADAIANALIRQQKEQEATRQVAVDAPPSPTSADGVIRVEVRHLHAVTLLPMRQKGKGKKR